MAFIKNRLLFSQNLNSHVVITFDSCVLKASLSDTGNFNVKRLDSEILEFDKLEKVKNVLNLNNHLLDVIVDKKIFNLTNLFLKRIFELWLTKSNIMGIAAICEQILLELSKKTIETKTIEVPPSESLDLPSTSKLSREPMLEEHFKLLLCHAGTTAIKNKEEKTAQLKLIFILLYYLKLRINELDAIGKDEIEALMRDGKVSLTIFKKNGNEKKEEKFSKEIYESGIQMLKENKNSIDLLFIENSYKTITCSNFNRKKPMSSKQLIKIVNDEIKRIVKDFHLEKNYSSHSFRLSNIKKSEDGIENITKKNFTANKVKK